MGHHHELRQFDARNQPGQRNKIIFEKTRAEAVINSLKEASIGIDKNNTILFANDQALQLLNLQIKSPKIRIQRQEAILILFQGS